MSGPGSQTFKLAKAREHEVGRIAIGDRILIIAPAFGLPYQDLCDEICRFELDGQSFVIFETKEQRSPKASGLAEDLTDRLTGRELEIAVMVAHGHATKNIAYKLQISEWTVATYLRRIFAKLDVDSRAEMVYRCAPLIDRIVHAHPPATFGLSPSPCKKQC
jgi:DNA-binding CsgD family transcriptional regulator